MTPEGDSFGIGSFPIGKSGFAPIYNRGEGVNIGSASFALNNGASSG